jgi:hypothetical protein
VCEQPEHLGLLGAITAGVSEVIDKYGRAIVLEDDLVTAPGFLSYMNQALDLYADEPTVMQVSGYQFPVSLETKDAFFLPLPTSWGWATWDRAWRHFDKNMAGADNVLHDLDLRKRFDLDSAYPYSALLEAQLQGRTDSWAVRWYLAMFLRGGLTLYPPRSLVQNIGFDASGTHPTCTSAFDTALSEGRIERFPRKIDVDQRAWRAVVESLRKTQTTDVPRVRRLWHCVRHAVRRGAAAIGVRD